MWSKEAEFWPKALVYAKKACLKCFLAVLEAWENFMWLHENFPTILHARVCVWNDLVVTRTTSHGPGKAFYAILRPVCNILDCGIILVNKFFHTSKTARKHMGQVFLAYTRLFKPKFSLFGSPLDRGKIFEKVPTVFRTLIWVGKRVF